MLHITIEGTTASLVFMNNGSFTRKNLPYVEAVNLTKGISPIKVIREKSERFGTRIIKCYDVDARCSYDIIKDLIELEKEIMNIFGERIHLSSKDYEDITDSYQEALELQWEKRDIADMYEALQKELLALNPTWRKGKIITAQEYYNKQIEFKKDVKYYKKHHINGF